VPETTDQRYLFPICFKKKKNPSAYSNNDDFLNDEFPNNGTIKK
jgi:hypothetical protein